MNNFSMETQHIQSNNNLNQNQQVNLTPIQKAHIALATKRRKEKELKDQQDKEIQLLQQQIYNQQQQQQDIATDTSESLLNNDDVIHLLKNLNEYRTTAKDERLSVGQHKQSDSNNPFQSVFWQSIEYLARGSFALAAMAVSAYLSSYIRESYESTPIQKRDASSKKTDSDGDNENLYY